MTTGYVLGHSDSELKQLIWQSQALPPYTEQWLRMAGIRPGIRVQDVGCGVSDDGRPGTTASYACAGS